MAISVCEASLTESALVLPEPGDDSQAGAVVVFWGAVRATEEGRNATEVLLDLLREAIENPAAQRDGKGDMS